jgi:hypothetical protein
MSCTLYVFQFYHFKRLIKSFYRFRNKAEIHDPTRLVAIKLITSFSFICLLVISLLESLLCPMFCLAPCRACVTSIILELRSLDVAFTLLVFIYLIYYVHWINSIQNTTFFMSYNFRLMAFSKIVQLFFQFVTRVTHNGISFKKWRQFNRKNYNHLKWNNSLLLSHCPTLFV